MSKKPLSMTVARLHKLLQAEIDKGNARLPVCIDKPTFTHNLEADGCVILDVDGVRVEPIVQIDGDGGTKTDSKGRECYRTCFVIHGWGYEPPAARRAGGEGK